jgi:hypothetical protein
MVTTKSRASNSRSASRATTQSRTTSARADDSLVSRAGRTVRDRPYASAAIATGAVTAVAALAAGAFLLSRRDRSSPETSDSITHKVKGSFADARARIKDLIHWDERKSQQEIAEEALTLTATGKAKNPIDRSASAIKTGAIAY